MTDYELIEKVVQMGFDIQRLKGDFSSYIIFFVIVSILTVINAVLFVANCIVGHYEKLNKY